MSVTGGFRRWVPGWWAGEAGVAGEIASLLSLPLEGAFRIGSAMRNRLYDRRILATGRIAVPVVSVGNLTVGGTGKTPMAAWVARTLKDTGRTPWLLLRGYGTDEVEVHRELNPDVPVATGRDRIEAAGEAIAKGADSLILDDGFQHRRLYRDLDIVLVAAEQWSASRRHLPRGPWREPVSALRRAAFVIVTRKSASRAQADAVLAEVSRFAPDRMLALVHLTLGVLEPLEGARGGARLEEGEQVTAVSSLGTPEAFEEQLRTMGAVVHPLRFPDHHAFTAADVEAILREAGASRIVMTRKEAVKLRGRLPTGAAALVARQGIVFERGEPELREALREAVS